MSAQQTAGGAADQAAQSDTLEHLARVGLIAYGVVHVLVAWIAVQLAWFGGSGESADQSGALQTLADTPLGRPLLWIVGLGLFALALWQAAEVVRWRHGWRASGKARNKALLKSGKALAKAAIYASLGVLALDVANGPSESSSDSQQKTTAGVLGWPGGRWIVIIAAVVIIAVGVYLIRKGLTKSFLKEIDTSTCSARALRLITRLGQAGFPGKGIALIGVGALIGWAGITFDPDKATGLDGALRAVLDAPFGKWLLTALALGIAAFGIYCFARARYPERP